MGTAEIDHGLDGKEHAGPQHDTFARPPDMDDVRLVVKQVAEPMPAEIPHHAHVLALDIALDGGPDVAGGRARPDHRDAAHHRLVGDLDQAFGPARDRAHREHAAGIAVPAVEDQGDVDIDDIAVLERLLARDAVTDHVIDRGAGRFAIAAIHQGRGRRLVVHGVLEDQPVDPLGGDAGLHLVGEHVETFGDQLTGLAHAREGAGPCSLIWPVLRCGARAAST